MTRKVRIDIISDVICPWCYLGKARLEKALDMMGDVDPEIYWRPFMLDPLVPAEGTDRKQYMLKKFGPGPQLGEAHKRLEDFGRQVGIHYDFDAIKITPNTMNAHRLIRWALQAGPGIQGKVVSALFKAYFEKGRDIGKPAVLIDIAKKCGMDANIVEELLPTDAEKQGVVGEIREAQNVGISGVPFFIFEQKFGASGALEPQALIAAIEQAINAKAAA